MTTRNIPSLDGWRAVAIALVFVGHAGYRHIVPGGLGVTIFFFLSGYLITKLLIDEHAQTRDVSLRLFYMRRLLRLMPPLLITLVITYVLTSAGWLLGAASWPAFLAQLFYFSNYYQLFFDGANQIPSGTLLLWSLAVEEHFYAAYPIVFLLLSKRVVNGRRAAIFLLLSCAAVLLWRVRLVTGLGGGGGDASFDPARTYYATDTRVDSILFGCILAWLADPAKSPRMRASMNLTEYLALAAGLAMLLFSLLYREPAFRETWRYSLQGVALAPLFFLSIKYHDTFAFRWLNFRLMVVTGIFSYSLYLVHAIVLENLAGQLGLKHSLIPVALLLSFGYAALIDRYLDRATRRLRARLHPAPVTGPVDSR